MIRLVAIAAGVSVMYDPSKALAYKQFAATLLNAAGPLLATYGINLPLAS